VSYPDDIKPTHVSYETIDGFLRFLEGQKFSSSDGKDYNYYLTFLRQIYKLKSRIEYNCFKDSGHKFLLNVQAVFKEWKEND